MAKVTPVNNSYGDALFQMGRGKGHYGIAVFCQGPGGSEGALQVRVETTEKGYNLYISTHQGGEVSACTGSLEMDIDKELKKFKVRNHNRHNLT